jgi:hypothetical protein
MLDKLSDAFACGGLPTRDGLLVDESKFAQRHRRDEHNPLKRHR